MIIEFLYFDGCPSYIPALENLEQVVTKDFPTATVKLIRIDSQQDSEKYGFMGSPSIRVDGRDLEDKQGASSYNCRLYQIEGKLSGVPSANFIREKITYIQNTEKQNK